MLQAMLSTPYGAAQQSHLRARRTPGGQEARLLRHAQQAARVREALVVVGRHAF